jgi:hypothetical protein
MRGALGVLAAVMTLSGCDSGSSESAHVNVPSTTVEESTTTTLRGATVVTSSATMAIDPVSGPVGRAVRVRGGGCLAPGVAIAAVSRDGEEQEGAQPGHPDPSGQWTAEFRIPESAPSDARYEVTGVCYSSPGVIKFHYKPVPFDVT